jgi:RNA polymerase primary sigma factor
MWLIMRKEYSEELAIYLKQINRIPLITHEEELELSRRIQNGDKGALEKLVNSNLRLVIRIVKNYLENGVSFLDLIQEGNMGLFEAAKRYDPNKGVHFSTYSSWWIKQRVTRSISTSSRTIRLPNRKNDIIQRYKKTEKELLDKNGIIPSIEEIAEEIHFPYEELVKLLTLKDTCSLDSFDGNGEDCSNLYDLIVDKREDTERNLDASFLRKELFDYITNSDLKYQDIKILQMRYGLNGYFTHTLEEIGIKQGVTREAIRQAENRVLKKLIKKRAIRELGSYLGK